MQGVMTYRFVGTNTQSSLSCSRHTSHFACLLCAVIAHAAWQVQRPSSSYCPSPPSMPRPWSRPTPLLSAPQHQASPLLPPLCEISGAEGLCVWQRQMQRAYSQTLCSPSGPHMQVWSLPGLFILLWREGLVYLETFFPTYLAFNLRK